MPATCVPWPQLSTGVRPPLTKSLKARMRLSGRSACGAMPESMIATEMPLRDGADRRGRAADRRSTCAPRCRAPAADASTRTPASSETCVACAISLLNDAALPKTTSAGPASVSTARTAAPRSSRRLNAASRSAVVANCMMTRARLARAPPPPAPHHRCCRRQTERQPATLTTSDTASVRQHLAINCMQDSRIELRHTTSFKYFKRLSRNTRSSRSSLLQPDRLGYVYRSARRCGA